MLLSGHRGMGENLMGPTGVYPSDRENALKAFQHASHLGVDFVEFDVQVTKDGVPVIWHDDVIHMGDSSGQKEAAISDLTVSELQGLWDSPAGPKVLRRFHDLTTHQWRSGLEPWLCKEEDKPPKLVDLFVNVPEGTGFDIEIKLTTPPDVVHTPDDEVDRLLSATLPVVEANAAGRRVFFSSFDPDVCVELARRQSRAVYFLSGCGLYEHADPRRTSIAAALSFAAEAHLAGVVLPASVLMANEKAMREGARDLGLALMTYGLENNDLACLQRQADAGVAAAIVDAVEDVMAAVRPTREAAAAIAAN